MIAGLLFQPEISDHQTSTPIQRLETVFDITDQSTIEPYLQTKWVIETGHSERVIVKNMQSIHEYGIPNAVHVLTAKKSIRDPTTKETNVHTFHYLSILLEIIEGIDMAYGFCDYREKFEPRHIPSRGDFRTGCFEQIFWLNVFGPEYIDRYGEEVLLEAPAWHTTKVDEYVVMIAHRSPFLAPDGYASTRAVTEEIETYLEKHTSDQ